VIDLVTGASLLWLTVGGFLYVAANICRACRFAHLLTARCGRFRRLLAIAFALSMFNNVLPSRGGELTFVYMMRRHHEVASGEAAAILVVARIFDYLTVATLFVATSLLILGALPQHAVWIIVTVSVFLLLSVGLLAAAPWLGRRGLAALDRLLACRWLSRRGWSETILRGSRSAVRALEAIRTPRVYGLTALWSLLAWLATFAWFWAFMAAIDIPTSAARVVVGATFAVLSKAIPFVTVGGLGAHEAGWTVGFVLVGLESETAIASGFAVNILTLIASLLFGGLGLLGLSLSRRFSISNRDITM
jgi:uncharacterized protein (TIRG00374 family)